MDNALIGLELTERLNPESRGIVQSCSRRWALGTAATSPAQLSGGMRQQVALVGPWRRIRACYCWMNLSPHWIIGRLRLEDAIVDTLKERGKTAILVTHDLSKPLR